MTQLLEHIVFRLIRDSEGADNRSAKSIHGLVSSWPDLHLKQGPLFISASWSCFDYRCVGHHGQYEHVNMFLLDRNT